MLCLALETSSRRGSIALGRYEGAALTLLAHRVLSEERRHAAELLPSIQEMLAAAGVQPADVNVLAFSQGPGSFTGSRIAATVARMWQATTACRVVGVPTLEVVARNALPPVGWGEKKKDTETRRDTESTEKIAVIVDARRELVFGAVFGHGGIGGTAEAGAGELADELRAIVPAGVYPAASFIAGLPRPCAVLGDAVAKYRPLLGSQLGPDSTAAGLTILPEETWFPDARQVLELGLRRASAGQFCRPEEIVPLYLRPPECEEVYEQRRAAAKAKRGG